MAQLVSELYKRYTALEHQIALQRFKQQEEANKAAAALAAITDEDEELIAPHLPVIRVVRRYTAEQLLRNESGEVDVVRHFYIALTELLDTWLKHYEDTLC